MLAWSNAPQSDRRPWLALLEIARSWSPPPFPVSGAMVKAAGVPEGPKVGQVRRAIEAWWIAQDFADDPQGAEQALSRVLDPP